MWCMDIGPISARVDLRSVICFLVIVKQILDSKCTQADMGPISIQRLRPRLDIGPSSTRVNQVLCYRANFSGGGHGSRSTQHNSTATHKHKQTNIKQNYQSNFNPN